MKARATAQETVARRQLRLAGELQAAKDALHGLVVSKMLTAEQEASVLITAACYCGWDEIDYIQRVVERIKHEALRRA